MNVYRTLMKPMVTYVMETTVLNKNQKKDLRRLKRSIIRTILCSNIIDEGNIRRKTNAKIEEILDQYTKQTW